MLNSSLVLLISIAAILILLRIRVHPGFAILVGGIIISLMVLPLQVIPALFLRTLIDQQTIRLLVIIASALSLSSLMEEKGLLAKLAATMESFSPRIAILLVPAVIGLVPIPGGALVSATASRGLSGRLRLTPAQSTFINYWFRHLWEFSIPVYPSIIITSVILSIPIFSVVKILAPMTAAVIVIGAFLSYGILRKTPHIKRLPTGNIALNLLKASWPTFLLIIMILSGLEAMIAFPLTLVLLAFQQRVNGPQLKQALKYGLNPKILFLLYAIMLYKAIIESSDTAVVLISDMQAIGLPALVILVVLPFIMGFATGFSSAFVGVALPLLVPFIVSGSGINGYALILAYVSGMMGLFLSPLHLCLILSAEYFKASLTGVYKYLLAPVMVIEVTVILIYYLTG